MGKKSAASSTSVPAGWYLDGKGQRWWDGISWTHSVRKASWLRTIHSSTLSALGLGCLALALPTGIGFLLAFSYGSVGPVPNGVATTMLLAAATVLLSQSYSNGRPSGPVLGGGSHGFDANVSQIAVSAPPGWYPVHPGYENWWDGHIWSESTRQIGPPAGGYELFRNMNVTLLRVLTAVTAIFAAFVLRGVHYAVLCGDGNLIVLRLVAFLVITAAVVSMVLSLRGITRRRGAPRVKRN